VGAEIKRGALWAMLIDLESTHGLAWAKAVLDGSKTREELEVLWRPLFSLSPLDHDRIQISNRLTSNALFSDPARKLHSF
jgi:hypothetical protein